MNKVSIVILWDQAYKYLLHGHVDYIRRRRADACSSANFSCIWTLGGKQEWLYAMSPIQMLKESCRIWTSRLGVKKKRSLVFSVDRKIPTLGSTVPVGNSASLGKSRFLQERWTLGWDFPVSTEHQWWILFIPHGQRYGIDFTNSMTRSCRHWYVRNPFLWLSEIFLSRSACLILW